MAFVFVKLTTSERLYLENIVSYRANVDDSESELVLNDSEKLVESEIFNESCHVDFLGLPKYVADICHKENNPNSPCKNLTCRNIISGEFPELYPYAKEFMRNHSPPPATDSDFISWTKNCGEFLQQRGYNHKMTLHDDADFPIAFNFVVHSNVEQIERLLHTLYSQQHQFCLHVDLKAPNSTSEALLGIVRCLSSNVFIASKREVVIYAGHSRLKADVNCMADHVKRKTNWKYLINTAGEAFPLKSNRELVRILKTYNGSNDIEGIYYRTNAEAMKRLYEKQYIELKDENTMREIFGVKNPPPPHDIDIVKGSAYGAFSRGFVEFVVNDVRARDLLEWMTKMWSPDEMYWATLQHSFINPHLRPPGFYSGFPSQEHWMAVYVNWDPDLCKGSQHHHICVFGIQDLSYLVRRRELFANKFKAGFEPLAQDCLKAWIEHKNVCPVRFDLGFYKSLARVQERRGNKFV
jgi:beta-1,3-galactosyl-O-glycosyl-glycoprotein beta-1,6-N-acetylglucosaminyltransferase/N-acetyllactosaminide beta-1,6-N-acetylglucosaminyltransferase/mucin type N-acetylglucosaminyltransferase 3